MKRITALALTLLLLLAYLGQGALATTVGPHTHHWVDSGDSRPATCTESGVKYEVCDICWERRTRTIPALGHSFTKPWQTLKEPTCTEAGKEVNYCQRINYGYKCNYEWRRDIPALGHDWTDWYVVQPAKPGEPSIEERRCTRCGLTEQRPLYVTEEAPSVTLNAYIPDQEPTYYEGEKIPYVLEITNNSDIPLFIRWVYHWEPDGSNGYVPGSYHLNIGAHDTITVSDFSITVTKADLEAYFAPNFTVQFTVDAYKSESDAEDYTDEVENNGLVYVTAHIGALGLTVEKTETSMPANGKFYTEGEEITYDITVTNQASETETAVTVYDYPDDNTSRGYKVGEIASLAPDASTTLSTQYQVTKADCEKGSFLNVAAAMGTNSLLTQSQPVTSPCGAGEPSSGLKLTKTETSAPANGSFYVEGEEVLFTVTFENAGPDPVYDVKLVEYPSGWTGWETDYYNLFTADIMTAGYKDSYTVPYTVKEADCEKGSYTNLVQAVGYTVNGKEDSRVNLHDTATVSAGFEEEGEDIGDMELWIEKKEISTPANGSFYTENEEIVYQIDVWNCQGYPLYNVRVWDLKPDETPLQLAFYDEFGSHQAVTFTDKHTVTAQNCADGSYVNRAIVYWQSSPGHDPTNDDNWIDSTCTVDCGSREPSVYIHKEVISKPENGIFYTEGEEIQYKIRMDNYTGQTLHDVWLHDTMMSDEQINPPSGCGDIGPDGFLSGTYSYKVTASDADTGCVINTAFVTWYDDEGDPDSAYSETLITPAGKGTPDVIEEVILAKRVISVPDNGTYYTQDEMVIYEITITNNSSDPIYDVEITDPIKGSNEDSVIDIIPELGAGETATYLITHQVTAQDVDDGVILNQAEAVYTYHTTEASDFINIYSNIVTVYTGGNPPPPDSKVFVHKSEVSTPANGSFYVEGEEVKYSVSVENAEDFDIYNVSAYDGLFDDTWNLSLGYWPVIKSGETGSAASFSYTVTSADVDNGGIVNQAVAEYNSDEYEETGLAWSNTVYVTAGKEEEAEEYPMSLTKTVVNPPANGIAYVESETISYLITFVNASDADLVISAAYDTVYNTYTSVTASLGTYAVPAHGTQPIPFSYTVTSQDVAAGFVTNLIEVLAVPAQQPDDEELHFYLSDDVTVETMIGRIERVREYPAAFKYETSHPKAGTAYTEGEVVEYDVILYNPTGRAFSNIDAYDILLPDTLFWHSHYAVLDTSPITIHVQYTVTDTDVDYKSIYNIAWFSMYDDDYKESITVYSNEVIVNTGKGPTPPTPGAPSHCEYKLVAAGVGAEMYSNEYCSEHGGVEAATEKLIAAAKTDAELDRAWSMAADMWRRSLDEQYKRLTDAAQDGMKEALEKDAALFTGYLDALRARLAGQGESARTINEKLVEALRDRTCELCYTQGTAPEVRGDVGECENEVQRVNAPACSVAFDTGAPAFYTKSVNVCDRHLPIVAASQRILSMDAGTLGWSKVNAYWQSVLQNQYEALLREADPLTRHYILTERAAFLASVSARNALYLAYYPGENALADELAARMIQQAALGLCK